MKLNNLTLLALFVLILTVALGCGAAPAEKSVDDSGSEPVPESTDGEAAADADDRGGIGQQLAALLDGVKPPRSYEMNSVPPAGQPPMSMIVKMGEKNPVKIKSVHEDGWMLVDLEKGGTYAYEPSENIIINMPTGTGAEAQSLNPSDLVHPDTKVLGTERVDGVKCWVVESKVGPMESKVWIGTRDGLPRQFETDEGLTKFVYTRVNEVPDSEFDLPDGIQVMDMAAMMKQGFKQQR